MIAMEVKKNGKMLVTAGRANLSVLNLIIDAVGVLGKTSKGTVSEKKRYKIMINVGGFAPTKNPKHGEFVHWIERNKLKVGDEITVKLVERSRADRPTSVERNDEKEEERMRFEWAKEEYFRLKEKYDKKYI